VFALRILEGALPIDARITFDQTDGESLARLHQLGPCE
jgi:hypothetical protein